jgi:hypothetical protein
VEGDTSRRQRRPHRHAVHRRDQHTRSLHLCDGYHYHDRCAHLITIRQAQLLDVLTVDGDLVRIPTLADEAVEAVERLVANEDEIEAEAEPEAVRSDGGRRDPDEYTAGSDDETFGRPEAQL